MGKITYETHFKSKRPDGRHTTSFAAYMERMRKTPQKYALPKDITADEFKVWQKKVIEKYKELLRMPEVTEQPAPKKLSEVQRDGYRVEKWEHYPDDYTAVPFLVLIPDSATKENPAPGVVCVPGSTFSKEFLANEPFLEPSNCRADKFPDRNKIAYYMVKQGYVAFAVDNIATAECGFVVQDETKDGENYYSRNEMCFGYLYDGTTYPGMQIFQLMNLVKYIHTFPFVDMNNVAVAAHSLGTLPAASLGLFCDEIKAVVFNDFVGSYKDRYVSITECEEGAMHKICGLWHLIPGFFKYFDVAEICAALAPKYLACNEGGADVYLDTVKRAYEVTGNSDKLQLTHYPRYQNPEDRKCHGEIPKYGLTQDEYYYDWCYCDIPEHAFKKEPSMKFLKQVFGK